jgi:hypothetical protein
MLLMLDPNVVFDGDVGCDRFQDAVVNMIPMPVGQAVVATSDGASSAR